MRMEDEISGLLNKQQAAKYLGVSVSKLEDLMNLRDLPFYKLGPANKKGVAVRFKLRDLDRWLESCLVRSQ